MPTHGRATAKLARAILAALRAHEDRLRGGPLVLAVSGGADSLALLFAAASLSPRRRPELVVAHFSHGLRPSAEKREAVLVRRAAAACGLPVAYAAGASGPTEADARNARYAFLAEVARSSGARAVATAHTEDDQAETVLLRLTRGAGLRGAAAMAEIGPWPSDGEKDLLLLRPLLGVPRTLTEQACEEVGVRPARDGSNRNVRFARNRVRRRVLPELERVNPGVRSLLAGFALSARDDDALLAAIAVDAVAGAEMRSDGAVSWPRSALAGLPLPLFARVAQDAFRHVCGAPASLSRTRVAAMRRLAAESHGGELALGGGVRFVVEQEMCQISGHALPAHKLVAVPLATPGTTAFGGWELTAALTDRPDDSPIANPWQAWLDADVVSGGLCVRAPARGDRFQPLGMDEGVRLQDVLVNAKVPRSSRALLPLVGSGRGIAWVPGVRVAHWARVTADTRRVLVLTAQPVHGPG